MKKNRMMRLASILLVLVLMTSSVVGGTFAKYVTTAEGSESARVAEWGVEVGVAGLNAALDDGLFLNSYAKDSSTTIGTTVEAEDKVVAPGTKNEEGVSFTLKGQPEVAVNVEVIFTVNNDVVLPEATGLTDYTESVDGVYSETFDNAADYYPVVFTLTDKVNGTELKKGNLTDIKSFLNKTAECAPNTDLTKFLKNEGTSGEYLLTWAWDFDDATAGTYDKQDTLLGQIAAGKATVADASTELGFEISITVTQID